MTLRLKNNIDNKDKDYVIELKITKYGRIAIFINDKEVAFIDEYDNYINIIDRFDVALSININKKKLQEN